MRLWTPLWLLVSGAVLACSASASDDLPPRRPDVGSERTEAPRDTAGSSDAPDVGSTSDVTRPNDSSTPDLDPADGGPAADLADDDSGGFKDTPAPTDIAPDSDVGAPPPPVTTTRYVRIVTTESPSWVSWKEVQVFGSYLDSDVVSDLALRRPATASDSASTQEPGYGVDGDEETSWNADRFPPAWFEVDLERPARIERIRLLVGQNPTGRTVHEIQLRSEAGANETIHTFNQVTEDEQWLEFVVFDGPDVPDDP